MVETNSPLLHTNPRGFEAVAAKWPCASGSGPLLQTMIVLGWFEVESSFLLWKVQNGGICNGTWHVIWSPVCGLAGMGAVGASKTVLLSLLIAYAIRWS